MEWELHEDFLDENVIYTEVILSRKLYFDRIARSYGTGAGVIFITLHDLVIPYSFALTEKSSP